MTSEIAEGDQHKHKWTVGSSAKCQETLHQQRALVVLYPLFMNIARITTLPLHWPPSPNQSHSFVVMVLFQMMCILLHAKATLAFPM